MRKTIAALVLTVVLSLALAAPAFAATGREYGAFHSNEARMNGGFTGTSNPGLNHTGFSGFTM